MPQEVEVERQPRRLGGTQAYWRCGQCSALRSHLYVVAGVLACRKCHGLGYRRVPPAVARAAKIRKRLGAPPGLLAPIPRRPRHWHPVTIDGLSPNFSSTNGCSLRCLVVQCAHWSAGRDDCIMDDSSERDGAILEQRITGKSVISIAEQYQCETSAVEGAIERRLNFSLDNDQRLKLVKLDCARIEALMVPFFERAVKDRDVAAGTLVCKLLERRSLLLGLDSPTQSRVDVYQVEQRQQPSRHERIKEVINRLWEQSPQVEKDVHERVKQLTPEKALELLGPLEPKGNGNGGNGSDPD